MDELTLLRQFVVDEPKADEAARAEVWRRLHEGQTLGRRWTTLRHSEEAIDRRQVVRPLRRHGRRRRYGGRFAVAAAILVGGLLVTPAFGIGSRLLALIESAPGPREVRAPVWSSGGGQIAFLSRRGVSNFDLDVVNADGSGQRTLFHGATREPPSWSPDGRKLAFVSARDGTTGVYVVNADGSGRQRLARDGKDPAWSPDGRTIAFFSGSKIYLMNADGSEHRPLTPFRSGGQRSLAWSPDGRKLAFLNDGERMPPFHFDLYVVGSDGSGPRNLTSKLGAHDHFGDPGGPASDPAWSPDGQTIAFVRLNAGVGEPIYVVKADGSGLRNLTPKPVGAYAEPAWSPDGRKIAFVSKRDGNYGVYVMNANGKGQRSLTRNSAFDGDPAWSPDGRKIAFVSKRDDNYGVYVMNADGSGQLRLAQRSP